MKEIEEKFRENKIKAISCLNEIKLKIERLEKGFMLEKTNWGYVGDMGHLANELKELL